MTEKRNTKREMNRYRADVMCVLLIIFYFTGYISGRFHEEINNYLISKIREK